jgi:hypothetical protein
MKLDKDALNERVAKAVRHFWRTRGKQSRSQGKTSGRTDQGARRAVTGGAHMDGFVSLIQQLLIETGLSTDCIYIEKKLEIPGFFRAEKEWDLLVVAEGQLLAAIEFKSQVGPSFGNNFNNRTEESLGNATDLWTAYREGAFKLSSRPWLGYLMHLEETPASLRPVKVKEPHFQVFEEFHDASYKNRYEILLTKLLRERLYDGACLLLSSQSGGPRGQWSEPSDELGFQRFIQALLSRIGAFLDAQ